MSEFQKMIDSSVGECSKNRNRAEVSLFALGCAVLGLGAGIWFSPFISIAIVQAIGLMYCLKLVRPVLRARKVISIHMKVLTAMKESKVWTIKD